MTQEFYTLVTDIGIAKFTNAQITQTAVNLSHVAVGDGDGKPYNPTQKQTALINERWRGQVSSLAIDEENENYVNIEVTIPSSVGGWMIREIGVFDDEGDLILISKQPETFKPTFSMGSVKDMLIRLVMELSNTDVAEIKIDPTIITASRAYVDKNLAEVDDRLTTQLAHISVDVTQFGVVGDGITNDTVSLQKAIDAVSVVGGGTVIVPPGLTCAINVSKGYGISILSNVVLEFKNGAALKVINTNSEVYEVIRCFDVENFKIINAHIIGDRATNSATKGHGHGIGLYGVKDFELKDCNVKDTIGDGYFLGYLASSRRFCEKGKLLNCNVDNASRNGISIISVDDVQIIGGNIENTNGASPQAGIDIEPYGLDVGKIENLVIRNVKTRNNFNGIISSCRDVSNVSMIIEDCVDIGSSGSSYIFHYEKDLAQKGQIYTKNLQSYKSRTGINIHDYSAMGAKVILDRPRIFEYNPDDVQTLPNNGIALHSDTNITQLGNIDILEPYITTSKSGFPINLYAGNKLRKVTVVNPILLQNGTDPTRFIYCDFGSTVKVIDNNNATEYSPSDANYTESAFNYHSVVNTNKFTAQRIITLSRDRPVGTSITFNVLNGAGIKITTTGGEKFLPLSTSQSQKLVATQNGASIKLKKVIDSVTTWEAWQVEKMIGLWTIE